MSCPRCSEGYILPGDPKGSIQADFAGAYLATPSSAEDAIDSSSSKPLHAKRTVVLLTDVFGLPLKNPKLIADSLAEKLQCDVWIPDYFNGRPLLHLDAMNIPSKPNESMSVWQWVQWFFSCMVPNLGAHWASRPAIIDHRVASFIALIKEKRGYEQIGAVGYCYGGSACVRLASTSQVDSVVICHPGPFSQAQVKAIRVPTSWVCAQVDVFMPDTVKQRSEAELAGRKGSDNFVEYEFVEYKGTTHGFACRPDLKYPDLLESYNKALDQTAAWFEKTLKT